MSKSSTAPIFRAWGRLGPVLCVMGIAKCFVFWYRNVLVSWITSNNEVLIAMLSIFNLRVFYSVVCCVMLMVNIFRIHFNMAMDQYLYIPFLGGWTSIYIHLPAILMFTRYQGFDPSPYILIWQQIYLSVSDWAGLLQSFPTHCRTAPAECGAGGKLGCVPICFEGWGRWTRYSRIKKNFREKTWCSKVTDHVLPSKKYIRCWVQRHQVSSHASWTFFDWSL